jgi:hypothetical protein
MRERLTVAPAEVEIFDRDATIEKLGQTAEAASRGVDPTGHYHRPDVFRLDLHQGGITRWPPSSASSTTTP